MTGDLIETDGIRPAPDFDDERPRVTPFAGGTPGADPSSSGFIPTQLSHVVHTDQHAATCICRSLSFCRFLDTCDNAGRAWCPPDQNFQICSRGLTNVAALDEAGRDGANSWEWLRSRALSLLLCMSRAGAPSGPMEHTLKAGSCDDATCRRALDIIDNCRACRMCHSQRISPQTTVDLPSRQYQKLKACSLFYEIRQAWHIIEKLIGGTLAW